jgi:hypothetical protein
MQSAVLVHRNSPTYAEDAKKFVGVEWSNEGNVTFLEAEPKSLEIGHSQRCFSCDSA